MNIYSQHLRENENGISEICPFDYLEFYDANIHPYDVFQFYDGPGKIYEGITADEFLLRHKKEGFIGAAQLILNDKKLSELQEELEAEGKQVCMFNLYILCLFLIEKAKMKYVALLKPTTQDILSELKNVSKITFNNEDGTTVESTSDTLIKTVLEALEAKKEHTTQQYEVEKVVTWDKVSNKILIQSCFVYDLSVFLFEYFPVLRKKRALVSAKEKKLILYLLKLFGLSPEQPTDKRWFQLMNYYKQIKNSGTEMQKLKADGKTLLLRLCFIPYSMWHNGKIDWTDKDLPKFDGEIGCTIKF